MSRLFLRKSVQDCEDDIRERGGLRRTLGKWHLTALGVGATIGAGIFATTGTAIVGDSLRPGAGPAIVLSFLLTAAHLRLRGALLRRVRRHGADFRLGLHLRLRVARRAGGVDHRLGPDRRVRGRKHRRRHRMVGVFPGADVPLRCPHSRLARHGLPLGAHRRGGGRWRGHRRLQPVSRVGHRHRASALRVPLHRQSAGLLRGGDDHGDPGDRHQGVGRHQQRDGSAQDRDHPVLLRGGIHPDQADSLERSRHRGLRAQRICRDQRRRGDHLLQLHRIRRDLHGGRGGQGPGPRHAVRHHHEPGRLHGALHRPLGRDDRHGTLAEARHPGADDHRPRAGRRVSAADHRSRDSSSRSAR